jgi:rhodanese-related sulfurtransferase
VNPHEIPSVTVDQVPDSGVYLLDVREDDEWAAGHAPNAVHVPMQDVPVRLAEIPADQAVVVTCRMGGRSAQVTAYLRAQGYDEVVNLVGGMQAWQSAGRPLAGGDGAPRVL